MSSLDTLALRAGIEEKFEDASGRIRQTSAETKRALLAALGIEAADHSQAAVALKELDRAEWRRMFPPVVVAGPKPTGVAVDAVLPAETSELAWKVQLESGGELSGTAACDKRTLVGKAQLDGRALARHRLVLEGDFPWGYHRLRSDLGDAECLLIITPGKCWLPEAANTGQRLWGVAAQLYLLRSETNWGIGDFTDLCRLVGLVAERGGDAVGLNPLHALFLDNPEHASPYSPEDRLLLNVLNIDVEAVPELADSPEVQQLIAAPEFQQKLKSCREASLVDYATVAELKLQALKLLFECCQTATGSRRWREFETFRKHKGAAFEQSCLFEALRQHFAAISGTLAGWESWPAEYQDSKSATVARFAEEHTGAATLYAWLQWIADTQLQQAAAAAKGMQVGLYRDLAVGTDRSGATAWSNPVGIVSNAQIGAPPDMFNPAGQDWGLPPFHPRVMYESGYRSFIDLVQANMRHAGGLRIDHVMALQHLYWVPKGRSPEEGAYVQYPLEDLIGILALESHRNHCLVVGEDLGTVPEGFRERMMAANILSYRVLFFEQDTKTGAFLPPDSYPRLALAVTGSHDLPTLRGWWNGMDIELKQKLDLFPTEDALRQARDQRVRDRRELLKALRAEGLLAGDGDVTIEQLTTAVHAYLARTDALIAMAQLDDITAEKDPVNVPATSDEHPNWRRRLSITIEELASQPRFERLARTFQAERQAGLPAGRN